MSDTPHIESLIPDHGDADGGYSVTIKGQYLDSLSDVLVDGKQVKFQEENPGVKIIQFPSGSAGGTVAVIAKKGSKSSNEVYFTYNH
ncbi:IPT/TIG domain-containing protein [Streptomyces lavenduligriseus]|uniref:IPT/TIG domain-containing protein n=1 Tax=Streptomyces lavenduligriseus TaxID=67315 RepID=A0ABT0P5B4_9ACTN|nr:IPT/TIG domain-containing protein [Streptomyces lavenduligriseus]MCL3998197.1 IPT/TIG domain-containing protein [Streptomyces lavenduligriseus]